MKTAYEIAMERLNKSSPMSKMTAAQKKRIAELESVYKARIAEKEIAVRKDIAQAEAQGDSLKAEEHQSELAREIKKLQQQLDEKKERVRNEKS